MLTARSKTTKAKLNSHKKMRKPVRETEIQGDLEPSTRSDIAIQCSDHSTKRSNGDSSTCKSLENLAHLKNGNRDTVSDISIVYGMYKTLLQKNNVNNEIHIENHQTLLNEIRKLQCQLNEQQLCHKSLANLVTTLMARRRRDRRMRSKRSDKGNKMMMLKLSQIASVIYKLQCSVESLETKSLTLNSKIDQSVAENLQKKTKKSSFCCCIQ